MFNSNLSLTVPPLLGIDGGVCTTPRTPEILNSLMAMSSPLDFYSGAVTQANTTTSTNSVSQTFLDSHSNSSDSPLDSPAGHRKTPSVQQTRSQLIKAGVKLLIQSKRKHSGCDSSDGNESSSGGGGEGSYSGGTKRGGTQPKMRHDTDNLTSEDDVDNHRTNSSSTGGGPGSVSSPRSMTGLTPDDEDRRRRRRERNKIAATKCRMKKRERTVNLVNESETLDAQNKDLKQQMAELESQRRKLIEVLQAHGPTCVHQKGYQPLPSLSTITNNNCKFLNDLNFLDSTAEEMKYSECLKSGGELGDFSKQDNVLPPGYCKLSPTEVTYTTPTDVMAVNSFATQQTLKSEYIPSSQARPPRAKPGPKPRQKATNAAKRSVTITSTTATVTETLPCTVPVTLTSADFILKSELIDTSSPYTTVQSADRFLFENSLDLYNNNNNDSNTLDGHHTNDSDKLASLAVKDNTSNALLEFSASFDTTISKPSDYGLLPTHQHQHNQHLHQHQHHQQQQQQQQHQHQQQQCHLQQNMHQQPLQHSLHHQILSHTVGMLDSGASIVTNEFLILPEHDVSEFTDLDSGITSYANINGGCLA
ncbi:activating transcription factor 3 isoform X2 [Ochlerotatus camptorhynchus]|uniref:activating transcription factor 3 isoform X2 n=1 Tax=Ochlerotatus camptorhynchus TaxID=644619 RepID=UPI0031DFBC4C